MTRRLQLAALLGITYLTFGYFAIEQIAFDPFRHDAMRSQGFYILAELLMIVWLPVYYFDILTVLRKTRTQRGALWIGIALLPICLFSVAFGYAGPLPYGSAPIFGTIS